MIAVGFTPTFLNQLAALPGDLQEEALEKVELFKDRANHKQLKVHKLKGRLVGRYSYSVNYQTRIVVRFIGSNEAILLAIGDHDVYRD